MSHKQNLVNLLCSFPNISKAGDRQTFISEVGLSKLAKNISVEGNSLTFFNHLIDVVVDTDGPDGLLAFLNDVISSGWVGVDRVLTIEKIKAELEDFDPEQWEEDFGYVVRPEPPIAVACPYQGLSAFREEKAEYFFGREEVAEKLTIAAESRSLVAVIGASGSGKSSLVFAGLIPQLRSRGNWTIADFRPGQRPFYHLAAALVPLLEPDKSETDKLVETKKLATAVSAGDLDLADAIAKVREKQNSDRLLLVADQFEELYALCRDKKLQSLFLERLLAASDRSSDFTLVLTLRADFYGYALSNRAFADALQNADLKLGPMNRQELENAVVKPAAILEVRLQSGLSDRILAAVGEKPGNLPLLEFALTELWKKQTRSQLTHQAYEEIGGVEQALVKYADRVYEELEEGDRQRVRRAFIQLVTPGEGTQDTRRTATAAELRSENWDIIKRLADSRLVVTGSNETGEETVEVIHEALIREWGKLREWIEASRRFLTWLKRLRERMREWEEKNKDEGALLRGAFLVEAQEWQEKRSGELSSEERDFIGLSLELRDREERERRRRRQQQILIICAFLISAAVAGLQWRQVVIGKEIASNSRMRGRINGVKLGFDSSQSLNATVSSIEISKNLKDAEWATDETLINGLDMLQSIVYWQGFKEYNSLEEHSEEVNSVAFSDDGKTIVSASSDKTAKIWREDGTYTDLKGHTELIYRVTLGYHKPYGDKELIATASKDTTAKIWTLNGTLVATLEHDSLVYRVAFSPKADLIVTATEDGTVKFWKYNGKSFQAFEEHKEHEDSVWKIAFSPNGNLIATASNDGTAKLWKSDGSFFQTLDGHSDKVKSVAFSPNGNLIATASNDGTIKIWASDDGLLLANLVGHDSTVYSVVFSPSGNLIASASADQNAKLWTTDGNLLHTLKGHNGSIYTVAFSPDGNLIATASADQTIKLWKPDGSLWDTFEEHSDRIYSAIFSPKDNSIASASQDGRVKVWKYNALTDTLAYQCRRIAFSPKGDLIALACDDGLYLLDSRTYERHIFQGSKVPVYSVAFSPKGDLIATGNGDGTVVLWRHDAGSVRSWQAHDTLIYGIAFSPNGDIIATASADNTVKLWKLDGLLENTLEGHSNSVMSVAFSPKEDLIVSASMDGAIKLWRRDGTLIRTLQNNTSPIFSATFSPNGDLIASASGDKTIRLWKTDGTELNVLKGHGGIVTDVAFSSKNDIIASTSHDKTLKIWKRDDGTLLHTFIGHESLVESLAFSPNGDTIVTVGEDHKIKLWVFDFESLLIQGCDWVRDYLNTLPENDENKHICDDIYSQGK